MKNLNFGNINVLPILDIEKNVDPEKLINALIDGKINTVEITLRNDEAFDNINLIRKKFPNLILGVGTIVNVDQLKRTIDLGADFGISPGFETEIIKYAKENNFSYIYAFGALHNSTDLMKTFQEIYNSLSDDGFLISSDMSENFDINDDPVLSKRIKDEFNLEILFTLPRIPRKDFYEELVNLDKLKKYIPKKMFK